MVQGLPRYDVIYGVRGAHNIEERLFVTRDDAEAFASRWRQSNSIGSYFAIVQPLPGVENTLPERIRPYTHFAIVQPPRDPAPRELLPCGHYIWEHGPRGKCPA